MRQHWLLMLFDEFDMQIELLLIIAYQCTGAVGQAYSPPSSYWFPPNNQGTFQGGAHQHWSPKGGGSTDGGRPSTGDGSGAGTGPSTRGADHSKVTAITKNERSGPSSSGSYSFAFESEDGSSRSESGALDDRGMIVQSGEYSYILPDGRIFTLSYVADSSGFKPKSSFLPPLPAFVQEQIEKAKSEDAGRETGGSGYNPGSSVGGVKHTGAEGSNERTGKGSNGVWKNGAVGVRSNGAGSNGAGGVGNIGAWNNAGNGVGSSGVWNNGVGGVESNDVRNGGASGSGSSQGAAQWTGGGTSGIGSTSWTGVSSSSGGVITTNDAASTGGILPATNIGAGQGPPAWIPVSVHAGAGAPDANSNVPVHFNNSSYVSQGK